MKLEKIAKVLPPVVIEGLATATPDALKTAIFTAEEAISKATRERDANPAYIEAKEAVKDLGAGLREVKSFQTAKIQLALLLLRDKGEGEELPVEVSEELQSVVSATKSK
jgi:hypothetical protein